MHNSKYLVLLPIAHVQEHLIFTGVHADNAEHTLYQIVVSFNSIFIFIFFQMYPFPSHVSPRPSGRVTGPWFCFSLHRVHPAVL